MNDPESTPDSPRETPEERRESAPSRLVRGLELINPFFWPSQVLKNRHRLEAEAERGDRVEHRLDRVENQVGRIEGRIDSIESILGVVQGEIEDLRKNNAENAARIDRRLAEIEGRTDAGEQGLRAVGQENSRLRDEVLPAVARRGEILLGRMMAEIEELGSLIERVLCGEPLPVLAPSAREDGIAGALDSVQPLLLEAFRGSEEEIQHRLDSYLDELRSAEPVIDLGCGRGELLGLLREAGIEARGFEADAALAQAARRRGLHVVQGDVLALLRGEEDGSAGAVTAFHLLEHLEPDVLASTIAEVRRVLRPGGLFLAECPDPRSLRVGGSLYWLDPTHQRPLHADTLSLFLRAAGLPVESAEGCHPFADEELLSSGDSMRDSEMTEDVRRLSLRVDNLARRLDEILHGSRDFVIRARKVAEAETGGSTG